MKWNHLLSLVVAGSVILFQTANAATNFWEDTDSNYQARPAAEVAPVNVLAAKGRRLTANLSQMKLELTSGTSVVIKVPLPNGEMVSYQFSRSSIMPDELALKYPQIQTFKAVDVNNPANRGRFDITPQGFHGMFQHDGRWIFIDPEVRNDDGYYIAYYGVDARPLEGRPEDTIIDSGLLKTHVTSDSVFSRRPLAGTTIRTYRLAMSAAAEYTAFHGGKTKALAAIATLMNRVNEIYERDLSIRFELVANNDDIVYTNLLTDPFDNSDGDAEANAANLPSIVPNDSFDIGHVLNTGGGGLAFLSGVCEDINKSIGLTGTSQPTGDAFYIDYVAHELGHQLGANHTFNGTSLACGGGNRTASTAWEPGSGSTIMGYAGICGDQNLQTNSDPYFHTGSIQQVLETAEASGCGTLSTIQNTIPIADAGADFVIPANTPFKLIGAGSDVDGDTLTYSWEQYDTGTVSISASTMKDDGSRPLFRSWEPSALPERYLPELVSYSTGSLQLGEAIPTTSRDLNFRLTVRDGKGGIATDEMVVTVVAGGSAFSVTEPTDANSLQAGSASTVTWEVAGTNQAPISCSAVDILMSANGDTDFDEIIVQSTPNDGNHEFVVNSSITPNAVIMVRCSSSGFYALSAGNLRNVGDAVAVNAASGDDSSKIGGGSFSLNLFLMGFVLLLLSNRRRFRPVSE